MKHFYLPLVSLLIVAVAVPSLAAARGKDNDHRSSGRENVSISIRHDNGLHLGQLKHAERKEDKKDKDQHRQPTDRLVVVRGTVSAINGSQLTVAGSGTTTLVDASQAFIFRSFWTRLSLADIRMNDQLVVWGTRDGNMVKARLIHNLSSPSQTLYRIGMSDDNRTITANVGDRFLLDLSNTYQWNASTSNPLAVHLVRAPALGDEGLYAARASGSSTLTLVGEPTCRLSTPACAIPSLLLRVNINVR
jgi:hypothetical protein